MAVVHWSDIADSLSRGCTAAGLDLARALRLGWYNSAVPPAHQVPGQQDRLAVLIGNTRAIWPPFVESLQQRPGLLACANPLDAYVERCVQRVLERIECRGQAYWAHAALWPASERYVIAMHRLADLSGLAPLGPCHLNVHPTYGPWIALRALVVFDIPGPEQRPEPTPLVCTDCESRCLPASRRALAATRTWPWRFWTPPWRAWSAVRESCPAGQDHRYSDAQMRYHQRPSRRRLRRLISPSY